MALRVNGDRDLSVEVQEHEAPLVAPEATPRLPRTPEFAQRKQSESTQAFLASIVESSDDSIIGTDLDGTIFGRDPDPIDLATGMAADLPLGVWDRLLLPRDGEGVQAFQGSFGL